MPCCAGDVPVTIDDCAVQVTAGNAGAWDWMPCFRAKALRPGVCGPSKDSESPTMFRTASRMGEKWPDWRLLAMLCGRFWGQVTEKVGCIVLNFQVS
jgi:hypothetical protein